MYSEWLSGKSIRTIAMHNGMERSAVHVALKKAYGSDACNLRKQSLARIVYREYGDRATADRARGSEGLFMSQKTMDNYSRANRNTKIGQGVYKNDNLFDYMVDDSSEDLWDDYEDLDDTEAPRIGVLLPLYLWIAKSTLSTIGGIYADALIDSVNNSDID